MSNKRKAKGPIKGPGAGKNIYRKVEPLEVPRWNFYECSACGFTFVTQDVHRGITPMMLGCKRGMDTPGLQTERCLGRMMSAGYRPHELWPEKLRERAPDAVWYMPDEKERKRLARKFPAMWQHVRAGGLILGRPITESQESSDVPTGPETSVPGV